MEGLSWREELLDIHFQDEGEFVEIMDTVVRFGEPAEVLTPVSTWKGGGNSLFKKGQFDLANDQYDRAAKYLTCTLLASTVDFDLYKELVIALLLNLAACAIKLGSFQRAMNVCSLVIHIQPDSIKAWFRRAKAALELGLITSAFEDLTQAVSLDPNNKAIQSEMGKVVLLFSSTIKGTRKLDGFDLP